MTGWIMLHRSILDSDLWKDKPFSKGQAWVDLLLLAEYESKEKLWREQLTEFKRGDVNISMLQLADRWGWSRDKVRRYISLLKAQNMVRVKATTNKTTITIVNWDKFQGQPPTDDTTDNTTDKATDKTTDKSHLNNIKNIKKEKKNIHIRPSLESEFDEIWNLYPKKQGKAKAFDYFAKAVEAGEDVAKIRDGVERYAKYVETDGIEFRYVKMGSTFFSQKAWLDEWAPKKKVEKPERVDTIMDGKGKTGFSNFESRSYDFSEIERMLVGGAT